jgi:hypothetical protein
VKNTVGESEMWFRGFAVCSFNKVLTPVILGQHGGRLCAELHLVLPNRKNEVSTKSSQNCIMGAGLSYIIRYMNTLNG